MSEGIQTEAIEAAADMIGSLRLGDRQHFLVEARLILEAAAPRIREQGYEDGVQAVRDALLAFAEERDSALGAIRSHITTYELRKILGVEE